MCAIAGTSLPAQTSIEGLPSPVLNFNPVALESETAAFGYLRERLFEQRVRKGPLAIRDIAPSLTARDGLTL